MQGLLSWQCKTEDDFIRCDGSQIVFSDNESRHIITSQHIPTSLLSFYFETKVIRGSDGNSIDIGMEMDKSDMMYRSSSGNIDDGRTIFDKLESFNNGDLIGCYIRRIKAADHTYQYCHFMKNQQKAGSRIIEGNHIYPQIIFRPKGNKSEIVEVETNLGNGTFKNELGTCKDLTCIKVILNELELFVLLNFIMYVYSIYYIYSLTFHVSHRYDKKPITPIRKCY